MLDLTSEPGVWINPSVIELMMGLVVLSLIGAVYGIVAGVIAGFFILPVLVIARRFKLLDAAIVFLLFGAIAWWYYDMIERRDAWAPTLEFLLPWVVSSAMTCGVAVWFFGRPADIKKDERS